ncbi:MAG: hypothetical protein JWN30_1401 [Bacilli bacterium]|nr:hypothetical protein [Bacilli bacterium]
MDELLQFVGVMSALSASTEAITQQMKKRFKWYQIVDNSQEGTAHSQGIRHVNIHLVAGMNGFVLAALAQVHPLQLVGLEPVWSQALPPWLANTCDYTVAGVLVSYGGPMFHELLGSLRAYKTNLRPAVPAAK